MQVTKIKVQPSFYKTALSAIQKLTIEEKQLLRLQLFATDALAEMKAFESLLKKKKPLVKKTGAEIVNITNSIRRKQYANSKKMLH